ncbi:cyclin-I2 [Perognathus longimembris pacificus]|uniref:cyclin-I2 n=1 Tax=Perognathus longimembris pacificus TaxID=214514 RepID=UPI00201A12B5|nr:cyclin-I2 [Perognathus longimembris pacificus]
MRPVGEFWRQVGLGVRSNEARVCKGAGEITSHPSWGWSHDMGVAGLHLLAQSPQGWRFQGPRPPAPASPVPSPLPAAAAWPEPEDRRKRDSLDQNQLLRYLQLTLSREERLWRACRPQTEICQTFQNLVLWLLNVENIFSFNHATMNLALTIFIHLLASVKVRERLLHIVTVTCLRLAVKINEEEESIPCVKDFIEHYGPGYSPNELLRMELAILDTLYWDLHMGTSLDFLITFHTLVILKWPHVEELLPQRNPSLHVESLTRQLQHCIAGHQLLQFKGSTLALVIITLELERLTPDCCAPTSDLLKKAQVDPEQFSRCKELVKQLLQRLQRQL